MPDGNFGGNNEKRSSEMWSGMVGGAVLPSDWGGGKPETRSPVMGEQWQLGKMLERRATPS